MIGKISITVSITNVGVIQIGDKVTTDFYGKQNSYTVSGISTYGLGLKGDDGKFSHDSKESLDWKINGGTGNSAHVRREITKRAPSVWINLSDEYQPDNIYVETIDVDGFETVARKGYNSPLWEDELGNTMYRPIKKWREACC